MEYLKRKRQDVEMVHVLPKFVSIEKELFFFVLFFEDGDSHVVDSSVVEHNDTTVGTRLDVQAGVLSELIIDTAEVVADCLNRAVQFVGNAVCTSVRQSIFDAAQLVE